MNSDSKEFTADLKSFFCARVHDPRPSLAVQQGLEKILGKHLSSCKAPPTLALLRLPIEFGSSSQPAVSCVKYIVRLHGASTGCMQILLHQLSVTQDVADVAASLHCKYQVAQVIKYAMQKQDAGDQSPDVEDLLKLLSAIAKVLTTTTSAKSLGGPAEARQYVPLILAQLIECIGIRIKGSEAVFQDPKQLRKVLARVDKYVAMLDAEGRATVLAKWERLGVPWRVQKESYVQDSASASKSDQLQDEETPLDLNDESTTPAGNRQEQQQIYSRGFDLLVGCASGRPTIKADAVRVQQTVTSVYKESTSEKGEIESISLAKALSAGKASAGASSTKSQDTTISPALNNAGESALSLWHTTGMCVDVLHDRARSKLTICQSDLDYLKDKLCGVKFNLWDNYSQTDVLIATTFSLVAQSQVLSDDIQNRVAKAGFGRKLGGQYNEYRMLLLKTLQLCAKRDARGRLPRSAVEYLQEFRTSRECTDDMKKILWQIFVQDDNNLATNFQMAVEYVQGTNRAGMRLDWAQIDSNLDYIRQQIVHEPRAKQLETDNPFCESLLDIVTLDQSQYPLRVRARVAQLIDDLLDHAQTGALPAVCLRAFVLRYDECGDGERGDEVDSVLLLKRSLVKCILKTIGKSGGTDLPVSVIDLLVRVSCAEVDHKLEALVTVSLGNLMLQNSDVAIPGSWRLAYKLGKADYVDADGNVFLESDFKDKGKDKKSEGKDGEEGDTNNEGEAQSKQGYTYVSAMTANILLHSCFKQANTGGQGPDLFDEVTDEDDEDEEGSEYSGEVLQHLLNGLSKSADKTTRIICAECLFYECCGTKHGPAASTTSLFNERVLWLIVPFTQDPVLDIRVYCTAIYCTALEQLLQDTHKAGKSQDDGDLQLVGNSLEELAQLYALDKSTVTIGTKDHTQYVNQPILSILLLRAGGIKFNASIFQLLTAILRMNLELGETSARAKPAVVGGDLLMDILHKQMALSPVPTYTLEAVEDRLPLLSQGGASSNSSVAALRILESASRQHKMALRLTTLQMLAKSLLSGPASASSSGSEGVQVLINRTLFSAIGNQDVPDAIFTTFNFHFVICRLESSSPLSTGFMPVKVAPAVFEAELLGTVAVYLRTHGLKLGAGHTTIFHNYLAQTCTAKNVNLVLNCMTTAAGNGQVFPEPLIQLIYTLQSPKSAPTSTLLSFSLALVHNQKLPTPFLDVICRQFCAAEFKIDASAEGEGVQQQIFEIITKCVQNNNRLSAEWLGLVVGKLCAEWTPSQGSGKDGSRHGRRLEILCALASLVNSGQDDQHEALESEGLGSELKRVFIEALKEESAQLLETGLHGFVGLQNNKFITCACEPSDVQLLNSTQRRPDLSAAIRESISDFLHSRRGTFGSDNATLQASINLSNLTTKSNGEFVSDLPMLLRLEGWDFFEGDECQERMRGILYSEEKQELLNAALDILGAYPHGGTAAKLPMATLEAVAFVIANTVVSAIEGDQNLHLRIQIRDKCYALLLKAAPGATFTPKLISYLRAAGESSERYFPTIFKATKSSSSKSAVQRIHELLHADPVDVEKVTNAIRKRSESSKPGGEEEGEECLDSQSLGVLIQILAGVPAIQNSYLVDLVARSVCALGVEGVSADLTRAAALIEGYMFRPAGSADQQQEDANGDQRMKKGLAGVKSYLKSKTKRIFGGDSKKAPAATAAVVDDVQERDGGSAQAVGVCQETHLRALHKLLAFTRLETPTPRAQRVLGHAWDQADDNMELRLLILRVAKVILADAEPCRPDIAEGNWAWLLDIALGDDTPLMRRLAIQALANDPQDQAKDGVQGLVQLVKDALLNEAAVAADSAAGAAEALGFIADELTAGREDVALFYSVAHLDLRSLQRIPDAPANWRRFLLFSDAIATCHLESPLDQMRAFEYLQAVHQKFDTADAAEDALCWLNFRLNQLADADATLNALKYLAVMQARQISDVLEAGPLDETTLCLLAVESCLVQKMGFTLAPNLVRMLAKDLCTSLTSSRPAFILDLCEMVTAIEHVQQVEFLVAALRRVDQDAIQGLEHTIQQGRQMAPQPIAEVVVLIQAYTLLGLLPEATPRRPRVERILKSLLRAGIAYEDVARLTTASKSCASLNFEYAISQAFQYQVSPALFRTLTLKLDKSASKSKRKAADHRATVDSVINQGVFDGKYGLKDIHKVVDEFRTKNTHNSFKWSCLRERFVKAGYEWDILKLKVVQVMTGDRTSRILIGTNAKLICKWGEEDILQWAAAAAATEEGATRQGMTDNEFYMESLMVASRAMKVHRNFDLTRVQALSCLVALQKLPKDAHKGQLQQVATGSGKSAIVAILAAIKALQGKHVDVYTSSPVLAERDAKEWAPFFALFRLTCDHNSDRGAYMYGAKGCYAKAIVYGDCSQFQFDYLRDGYSALGTLAGRRCDFAIIDEVDAMLLDDISKLARLSSQLPGMDTIQLIYHLLWDRLLYLQAHLFAIKDFYFYIQGQIAVQPDGLVQYQFAHPETSVLCTISDLFHYITQAGSVEELQGACIHSVDDIEEYVRSQLTSYVKALIKEEGEGGEKGKAPLVRVPAYLRDFVEGQMGAWVDSALTALKYEENVHYIVEQDQIKPVDYLTTGVVQSNTNWNNGLHQFLGLKHSVRIQPETVTTNFLSNLAMFEQYGPDLVGFSGTLGSPSGRAVLYNTYHVKLLTLPETHYKRYVQFPDVVADSVEAWRREIVLSCRAEAEKGRGVLIICETIKTAHELSALLTSFKCAVKLYAKNDEEQQLEERIELMHPGDMIVATNLAGRGTDIKTGNVEPYGGMHVCLTFLPQSQRIDEQAFGRTSRQGNKGTGQLIILGPSSAEPGDVDAEAMKVARDDRERATLEAFLKEELPGIRTRGRLFAEFCTYFTHLRRRLRENSSTWQRAKQAAAEMVNAVVTPLAGLQLDAFTLPIKETLILQSVEERWAMFLRAVDQKELGGDYEAAREALGEFVDEMEDKLEGCGPEQIMINGRNVFYFTQLGNFEYMQGNDEAADEYYRQALKLDPQFSAGAQIGAACTLLKRATADGYKDRAIESFREGLALLYEEMAWLKAVQTLAQSKGAPGGEPGGPDTSLTRQLIEKVNLLGNFINMVEANTRAVEKSLRRVHLRASTAMVEAGVQETVTRRLPDPAGVDTKERVTPLQLHRGRDADRFALSFHDLTRRTDMWTRDQAVNTLPSDGWFSTSKVKCEVACRCPTPNLGALLASEEDAKILLKEVPRMDVQLDDVSFDYSEGDGGRMPSVEALLNMAAGGARFKFESYDVELVGNINDLKVILKNADVEGLLLGEGGGGGVELGSTGADGLQTVRRFDLTTARARKNAPAAAQAYAQSHTLTSVKFLRLTTAGQLTQLGKIILDSTTNHPLNSYPAIHVTLHALEVADRKAMAEVWPKIAASFHSNALLLHGMNTKQATSVIPVLRKHGVEFVLEISGLDYESAVRVYQNAALEQEKMEQQKVQQLTEMYMQNYIPLLEIHLLRDRGLSILIAFNERNFIPWCSLLTVCGIAAAQVALGGFLITTGFGASMGVSLITEGFSDFQTAYRIYTTRQFSWSAYGTQKAVSLVISAYTLGLSGLKDGAKGLQVLGSSAVKKAASKSAANAVLTTSGKNLGILAVKKIGVKALETGGRIVVKELSDKLVGFCFEQIRPAIAREVSVRVEAGFGGPDDEFHRLLSRKFALQKALMGAVAEKPGESRFQQQIVGIVGATMRPGPWESLWDSVGSPLATGILSDPQYIGSAAATANQLWGALTGWYEIATITGRVFEELKDKLEQEPDPIAHILKNAGIRVTGALGKKLELAKDTGSSNSSSFEFKNPPNESDFASKEEFSKFKDVVSKLQKLQQGFAPGKSLELSQLQKKVADLITSHIIKVANSHIVSPAMSRLGGQVVSSISQQIQAQFVVSAEQNAPGTGEGSQTLDQQIHGNAKSYMQSYRQIELDLLVEKVTTGGGDNGQGGHVPGGVLEKAGKVATDAPIDSTLFAMQVKKHNLPVKVVTDRNYEPTAEEKANGVRIVVYTPGATPDAVGHYELKTEDGKGFVDVTRRSEAGHGVGGGRNDENDCGFQVLAEIRGTNAEDVRIESATDMLKHPAAFQEINEINSWFGDRYPQEANALLQIGGKRAIEARRLSADPENSNTSKTEFKIPLDGEEGKRTKQHGAGKEEADRLTRLTGARHVQMHIVNKRLGGTGDADNIIAGTYSSNAQHRAIDAPLIKLYEDHKGQDGDIVLEHKIYKDDEGRVMQQRFTYRMEGNEAASAQMDEILGSAKDKNGQAVFERTKEGYTAYLFNPAGDTSGTFADEPSSQTNDGF